MLWLWVFQFIDFMSQSSPLAGSNLCHDEFRKLSGSLCFVILLLLGTEILAKMSKKYRNEPKFTRVEPLLRQTGCVSRRHHTSVQGWGSTSHPQTTPAVLWWPPWSAAPSLHGLTMTSTYATSLGMHRRWSGVDPGWTQVSLFISVFFPTFLLIFPSLIKVRSQNKDDPTAYEIHHDISQNQRSELLTFLLILKTSLLIYVLVLYSILKNDIHTGKWGQGIWLQRSEHVLGLWILCLWIQRFSRKI